MDNNSDFREISTKLDLITSEIGNIKLYMQEKVDNTLLNAKIGDLSVQLDILLKENNQMRSALVGIKDLAHFGRPEQDHLPTIEKLAKKGLGEE